MDPRLLEYYRQELLHIREGAAEFAREHPKIAARLAMDTTTAQGECVDPYVERLLEGFAFLAARVHIRLDAEYPRFTQHLMEMVYPGYQAPVPSMLIAQLEPDLNDAGLAAGPTIPRGSLMNARLLPGERTSCRFSTGHDVRLWPLRLAQAGYQAHVSDVPAPALASGQPRACLRLRVKVTAALKSHQLDLDRLDVFLAGDEGVAHRIYEQIFANCTAVVVQTVARRNPRYHVLPASRVQPGGFADDETLLPASPRAFGGYRLLKEYAAFPERYLFVQVGGLKAALAALETDEFELLFVLDRIDQTLEKTLDLASFALHCTPAINLFPKRADRIELNRHDHELHVVPDRARPMDYEIYSVTSVQGYDDTGTAEARHFRPLYDQFDAASVDDQAYYTLRRVPRLLSEAQRQRGPRAGYIGTELYVSLVDAHEAPYPERLTQLSVEILSSNRDLPLLMSVGTKDDFSFEDAAPVQGVRCIKGPTRPMAPLLEGGAPWRLLSQLSLNYLSLCDTDPRQGAAALREILSLYGLDPRSRLHKQLDGIVSMASRPAISRVPVPGPITFGRGTEITLTADERSFEGSGTMVLASVLERFLARHASLNSFTQLILQTQQRGLIKKWKPRIGQRSIA
ncbi:type VI secretion system baseplate subunit TssF [Piscinibacter sakaiensis]|uniref:ImpG/VasA protein n=1 Tax=Piscinibacter sakaiensis TaxID=1547922 RepID=A0A0K8NX67_PISS1|nr:type VI secretion system baseplate subunit TssF [Piscinibacter sakaiensis]GAP34884.1 ImpG/VasA protein [Piscinibacter sakaiensis]